MSLNRAANPASSTGPFNGEKMKAVLKTTFDRLSFGGQAGRDQRVYFFNTKEILGNKYGTPSPVPFRVVDGNIGLDVDISIRCFGEYSYRVTNPMLFYTHVCGNVEGDYTREQIDSQLKSELLTALQPRSQRFPRWASATALPAGAYIGDRRRAQRRALQKVGRSARRGDRVLWHKLRQSL